MSFNKTLIQRTRLDPRRPGYCKTCRIIGLQIFGLLAAQTNPLDYFICGMVEAYVNNMPHSTIDSLRVAILNAVSALSRDSVVKACSIFKSRLEQVVANERDHFE